jgi:molybdopterin/thiamine biosynthesis adenylyltransferase/rhodanese-related sulfurtransferase
VEQNNNKLSSNEIARYSRHIILPEVGVEGQEKLKAARILVIGMGGLGSPSSLYLVAAGVGTLGLAEFDKIEEHNLHRQILHHRADIGKLKIDSAEQELKAINPDCKLILHREGITLDNAIEILSSYDMVVDGSDNLPTRYLVNDAAYFAGIPYIYGSIFKFEGQVSVFDSRAGGPNYRCLFPEMPDPSTVPSCEEAGVFGALCGLIGSLQAMEAIKYYLKIGESLLGRLLVIDALSMNFTKLEASNYEFSCEIPVENNTTLGEDESEVPIEIDVAQVKAMLDSDNKPYLLDVREDFEVEICKLDSSHSIPMRTIAEHIDRIPRDLPVVVYCHSGVRSLNVANFLRDKGFNNARSMVGGIAAWADKYEPEMVRY